MQFRKLVEGGPTAMTEDSRQLEAQALSKGCRRLQENVMTLDRSCYNFALKRTGIKAWHVSIILSHYAAVVF
jgi:hypothetical protein